MGRSLSALLAFSTLSAAGPILDCAKCHPEIAAKHARTGMGRSFYPVSRDVFSPGVFRHEASGQTFAMVERNGRFFQRREMEGIGPVEREVHFVVGSGNHARTFIHRTEAGRLIELPVGWYSARGGFWAMNPGYDRPDHLGFRRKLDSECLGCHTSSGQDVIGCARCHGATDDHAKLVNPARLSADRRLEVCLQCHLQSTSHLLPYAVRRFGRERDVHRPGAPLSDTILHFEPAVEPPFEIAQSAYGLMKSTCFRQSGGRLTCTTCHDPHDASIRDSCRNCHAGAHHSDRDCAGCHMPKRRTSDAVHVVMTDHRIRRVSLDGDPLAPLPEVHDSDATSYRGEVKLLYPPALPDARSELYVAVAQVRDGANLTAGVERLRRAIELYHPREREFSLELARAYVRAGRPSAAIPHFRAADPLGADDYAAALTGLGRPAEAAALLRDAREPGDLNGLGAALIALGRAPEAAVSLRRAIAFDPDMVEARQNLAIALERVGDAAAVLSAYRDLVSMQPDAALARFQYGRLLVERREFAPAEIHLRAALRRDPKMAEAAVSLGLALAGQGRSTEAIEQYKSAIAIQPGLSTARFNLGLLLARAGRLSEAAEQFSELLRLDPRDREARQNLERIRGMLR